MGQKLASSLNRLLDGQASDDVGKAAVVEKMASAAGIDINTVHQILRGEILCPPLERLAGFAEVLSGASLDSLRGAAEADGCNYSDRNEDEIHTVPIREVIPREQYERLQRIKAEIEEALDS